MALDATKVRVGLSGSVLWGTTGITPPTSAVSATTGYNDVGYLDEDGVTMTVTPSVVDFNVWQSRVPVRRENQAQSIAFSGNLAEWNAASVPVVFGGGSVAASGTYTFPLESAALYEFAGVIDANDGTKVLRFIFPRANQTEAVETQFNKANIATLSFNFGLLATAGSSPLTIYGNM